MWSGAHPRACSHWLIKTHMRMEDLMRRERSGLLSEGLITHSRWVARSLSHTWLNVNSCVQVCLWEKCDLGCHSVGVRMRAGEWEGDRFLLVSADWWVKVFLSENFHTWLVNVQLTDGSFEPGDTHALMCMQTHVHNPFARTCGVISGLVGGAVAITGSLTSPSPLFFFFVKTSGPMSSLPLLMQTVLH